MTDCLTFPFRGVLHNVQVTDAVPDKETIYFLAPKSEFSGCEPFPGQILDPGFSEADLRPTMILSSSAWERIQAEAGDLQTAPEGAEEVIKALGDLINGI